MTLGSGGLVEGLDGDHGSARANHRDYLAIGRVRTLQHPPPAPRALLPAACSLLHRPPVRVLEASGVIFRQDYWSLEDRDYPR